MLTESSAGCACRRSFDGTGNTLPGRGSSRGNRSRAPHPRRPARLIRDTLSLVKGLIRDERMAHRFGRFEPPVGIPPQTSRDKINKPFILRLESLLQRLRARTSSASLAADRNSRFTNRIEKEFLSRTPVHQMTVRRAKDFHNTSQLLLFILSWEDRIASPQLREDTAETPHVNPQTITTAQYYLRAAVEAGLDVRVHLLLLATGRAKIDDADVCFAGFAEEDVFRFEIAVDDAFVLQEREAGQELSGEAADQR